MWPHVQLPKSTKHLNGAGEQQNLYFGHSGRKARTRGAELGKKRRGRRRKRLEIIII
jgi:hypothetical protein